MQKIIESEYCVTDNEKLRRDLFKGSMMRYLRWHVITF